MTLSIWRYAHLALALISSLFLVMASVTGAILAVDAVQEKMPPYKVANFDEITLAQIVPVLKKNFSEISELDVDHNGFVRLKGFDEERFFVYLEDLDLSYRVKQAGYKIVYLTEAQAFHEGGGTSSQVKATRLFYSLRSRMLYAFKHFSKPAAWGVFLTTMIWEPVIRILFALLKGKTSDAKNTVAGYKMLWQHATDILQGKGK